ncbi:hypothetical protein M9H77_05081 [Catharanthus roseus]|uniref:Uncharacterized protein n=1 Tax=Catharanthus roseus TaxID=4058 RepID=A0ACC0CGB1_CATRO|nr:hypothetical protein M9H77_05081 [Catharanthus roseus]
MVDLGNSTVLVNLEAIWEVSDDVTCKTDKENRIKLAKVRRPIFATTNRIERPTLKTKNRTTNFCVKQGNRDIRTPKTDDKEQNRMNFESQSKPSEQ